jgi:hypothetical protein
MKRQVSAIAASDFCGRAALSLPENLLIAQRKISGESLFPGEVWLSISVLITEQQQLAWRIKDPG